MIVTASLTKTTSYRVVIPFYAFAALAFLSAATILCANSDLFLGHYSQPRILAITHTMALGWGTMIILGASHQLVPVMIEEKLYSNFLAYLSFGLAAAGIPLLVFAFYTFNMQWPAQCGALLINGAILSFLINLTASYLRSKRGNVHAVFVIAATLWLFTTTFLGLLLVYNFTGDLLTQDSLHYLSLHAHTGIAGWFLLMVVGVGSRLIPMFLISKYTQVKLLWLTFGLINGGLLCFLWLFFFTKPGPLLFLPFSAIIAAAGLFSFYCYRSYCTRIRRQVDKQVKTSLLSVLFLGIPGVFLVLLLLTAAFGLGSRLVLAYGFSIFFGWITAIIFGMTFKTLPFIVWNKVYHNRACSGKTPNPKDLFYPGLFNVMLTAYLLGFILFIAGIFISSKLMLKSATLYILLAAILYNWNVFSVIFYKPAAK